MEAGHLVMRDAWLVDGTGSPARRADVLLDGDTIAAVEQHHPAQWADVPSVELAGATLAPGFIDVHSHADNAPLLEEDDVSKVLQGVTTEVVGNCGFSLAPRFNENDDIFDAYARRLFPPLAWTWRSFRELFTETDRRGYVTNYAPLVGHHAIRIGAMGMADRQPTSDELRRMQQMLADALDVGVFGLSTGLVYPPGMFASREEVADLVAALPGDAIYATHMRGEGVALQTSLAEASWVAETTDRRVQVSHLKAAGQRNWGTMDRALTALDAARIRGADLHQDVYPYTAGSTMLTATLPPWFQEGGDESVLRRLEDPRALDGLRDELEIDDGSWENQVAGAGWSGIVIASSPSHGFDGEDLESLARRLGMDPFQALVHVLREESLQVSMIMHSMHEADLELALQHPATVIGSDGLPPGTGGRPHPRMFGTFPRVLRRYVRERRVLTLEEAIRKMTHLPAAAFRISDRGIVRPGAVADLVVFHPGSVVDAATYDRPTEPPTGLEAVLIGGQFVVRDGAYLGRRAGRRLQRAGGG